MSTATVSSYDEVPYTSLPYAATHPDHMAAMAALFGMQASDVETCRVVELGCASGGNLIPMAVAMPRATFVGYDLSAAQIDEGRATIRALGLENISLEQRDITALRGATDPFDYIICHGVYSWVPPNVQHQILEICRRQLSPRGVAYISYNTYPGWHLREGFRDMMLYHAGRVADPRQRGMQSRAFLDLLIQAQPPGETAYRKALEAELEMLRARPDDYLLHEHLEEFNEPLYFHQFMARAEAAEMQFLSESQFCDSVPRDFSPQVEQTLRQIAPDVIHWEQYLDFLRNRTFRRTLLCRREVQLSRHLEPRRTHSLHIAAEFKSWDDPLDLSRPREWTFNHVQGAVVKVQQPLQAAALGRLARAWPQSVKVAQLAIDARSDCTAAGCQPDSPEADLYGVARIVPHCLATGVIEPCLRPGRFCTGISAAPRTTPLARRQAAAGDRVTNLRHMPISLSPFAHAVVGLLDGSCARAELHRELATRAARGELAIEREGKPITQREQVDCAMGAALEECLAHLARSAMLVG